jgi:hypothetical protein
MSITSGPTAKASTPGEPQDMTEGVLTSSTLHPLFKGWQSGDGIQAARASADPIFLKVPYEVVPAAEVPTVLDSGGPRK